MKTMRRLIQAIHSLPAWAVMPTQCLLGLVVVLTSPLWFVWLFTFMDWQMVEELFEP